jgi:hypothetical protein
VLALAGALFGLWLSVQAPPALEPAAAHLRQVDVRATEDALRAAGLKPPDSVNVLLVPEGDPLATAAPDWVVGRAFPNRTVVIFPSRVTRYPYDSFESVLRHEIVHVALFAAAGDHPLPRWFHEGVSTSVEAGWSAADELRLLFAALGKPTIDEVGELFESESQPGTSLAYRLAAALIDDLRQRQGADLPGRIAERVSGGVPFERAFLVETGETPDAAAAQAWRTYRRLANWIPAIASASAVWTLILVLAGIAFVVQRRKRAQRRRDMDEEEAPW